MMIVNQGQYLLNLLIMKRPHPTQLGFTLIELLVVIAIIGVLIAMGAATFSVAQRQARNVTRESDAKAIQNCMEQCYVEKNNSYDICDTAGTDQCGGIWTDPKPGWTAYSIVSPSADSYTVTIVREEVLLGGIGTTITKINLQ